MWRVLDFLQLASFKRRWMQSHAQLPTPLVLDERCVRVFFGSRDGRGYSHVGWVDLRLIGEPLRVEVIDVSEEPVLTPGPIGFFDEHGVFPSCVVQHDGRFLLYYIGWNKGCEAPLFYTSIGVAASDDGRSFRKLSRAPLLSRSEVDPCLVTSPHVYKDDGTWRMTYVSGIGWFRDAQGRLQSRYHIKSAIGSSPFDWVREGQIAIDLSDGETNIARSSVLKRSDGTYEMWFSVVDAVTGKYRIGYAMSDDATEWARNDLRSGFGQAPLFASEMMCYPSNFVTASGRFMLFNGNAFGSSGFAIARWEQP
jgi:hypothetical protein